MELSEISTVTREVEILAPRTGKSTGLVFIVNSVQSDEVQKIVRERNDSTLSRRPIDSEEYGLKLLMAAIVGWEWRDDATFEGNKPDFNPANLRRVLESKVGKSVICDQLSKAIADTNRFFTI